MNVKTIFRRSEGNGFDYNPDHLIRKMVCPAKVVELDTNELSLISCKFGKTRDVKNILVCGRNDGSVCILDTTKDVKVWYTFEDVSDAVFDIAWSDVENKFLYASRQIKLVDMNYPGDPKLVTTFTTSAARSVKSVAVSPCGTVFASGGRDGDISIWDQRSPQEPVTCIVAPHGFGGRKTFASYMVKSSFPSSITGLEFQDDLHILSVADRCGFIKLWDLRKTYRTSTNAPLPKKQILVNPNSSSGFSDLITDVNRTMIYATTVSGVVYNYYIANDDYKCVGQYKGLYASGSFYVKSALSPDNKYLVCGDGHSVASLWKVGIPETPFMHFDEIYGISCMDWCKNGDYKLAMATDSQFPRIWYVKPSWENKTHDADYFYARTEIQHRYPSNHKSAATKTMKINVTKCDKPDSIVGSLITSWPSQFTDGNIHHHECAKRIPIKKPCWLASPSPSSPQRLSKRKHASKTPDKPAKRIQVKSVKKSQNNNNTTENKNPNGSILKYVSRLSLDDRKTSSDSDP